MSDLNSRERELVALGAAMGSNCAPCIEYHIPEARKAGLADSQILEAIRVADKVRQVPARKVLEAGLQLLGQVAPAAPEGNPCRAVTAPTAAASAGCCA